MNLIIWLQNANIDEEDVEFFSSALNVFKELYGDLKVLGAVTPPEVVLNSVPKISSDDVPNLEFDLILVAGSGNAVMQTNAQSEFVKVLKLVQALGIDTEKVVRDRVVCTPLFTLEKYNKLRRSKLSILSMNCFAGLLYHRFGLPFLTPTINMYTSEEDFLQFLRDPIKNVSAELKFLRTARNDALNIDFPIYKIGETEWHMNHYGDANLAYRKWYERSFRINWYNVLAVMYTQSPEILSEFDKLPFAKKICFVPFKSDLDSAYYLDVTKCGGELWRGVNSVASGNIFDYDIWDMLLYGKKTPLSVQK